ncbi:MAG: FIVAR domain-containing protein [Clostridiales bacterium]|nr:FIVAR domain-containing protein [Clostridiales bacterium]
MKKKMVLRLLSLAMIASMTGTMLPSNLQIVTAEESVATEEKTEKAAALEDGINDKWTQENKVGEDAVCEVKDGWLHLKSGVGNGNNPGTKPAMFVNSNTFDFTKDGYFEFTMKSNNENTDQNNSDRFGVYLGYNTDATGLLIGYDNLGWFWQKYGAAGNPWYQGKRIDAPKKGTEVKVRIDWTADKKMTVKVNDQVAFEDEDFSSISGLENKIAFKCGSFSQKVSDVFIKDIHYTGQKEAATYAVTGTVTDADNKTLEGATVKVGDKTATTDKTGAYSLELAAGTYDMTVAKTGYQTVTKSVTVTDKDLTVEAVKLEKVAEVETEVLSTDYMEVHVAKNFPSVVRYEMKKGDLKGKTFYGQTSEINTIRINGTDIKLSKDDVKATFKDNKATYELTVKSGDTIDAVLTAELVAKDDTVSFEITKVKNNLDETQKVDGKYVYAVQSIEIPNHSLISVNSAQENANLKGALMSSNTTISGDEYHEITADTELSQDYMYAFISNSEMSAGLWSNSENEGSAKAVGVSGGSHNTRVMATTEEKDGYVSLGLGSTKWYWHRAEQDSKGTWHLVDETDTPQAKVTIAGNVNGDEEIDWQDGAVAFRDIMHNPYKSEEVPELVAYRIAMNFGGQAQNPFLTTLDNVKRVAMHTDGLGQSVLLKGYGNEGHDSGHPDYADIGERIGGAEDMNTLMTKGAEYGAKFGIHVNAGEMYPEAKAFSEDLVRRDADGNLRYGWNWIDQGIGIDSVYDLGMGLREKRFDELEEKVGQNLDFVYVDIWGNKTGGSDDSWQTRKLSKEINDNGWRMATEWGSANEYDSTFQHWATDLTYGGYTMKGENSEVMRFLRNHQKDSWVGDYPSYGGAAMAPLLGGYNMKDFEGWQGRNDYDAYIKNLYTHDLTTKFIQHYEITDWEDSENSFTKNNPDKKAYTWTPEMKITLKNGDDTLVLERGSDNPDEAAYRDRTMTLNGKVIATGAVARGDNGQGGTEKYLLPWIWDSETGDEVDAKDEKLYHWNTEGGSSEWELPSGWENLKDVKVYKLTDLGKTDEKTVKVVDGKITLDAEAETPYVVCKGEEANLKITWSEGMHIVDAGFNSGNFDAWKQDGEGKAEIAKSQYSNPMMKLSGKVSMTQELTDLEAGKQYAVLVGVDNRSDAKASMTVKAGDKVLATNYTTRSIAKNYVKAYTHSNSSATVDGSSYFQNMYVFFTAPESGKVTLTLAKAAGEGDAYFDDVRIVENDSKNITTNDKGEVVKFEQDFEKSVQGLYPFVVAGIEGVEDNRIHLSELHAPYTQAGWDVKKMDDVLDGKWSVKINGLTQRSTLAYQTIPQNFRFEPGVTYKVSFDYQAGTDGIYAAAVGSGEYNGNVQLEELPMAMGKDTDGHYTTQITGDSTGQTWFGIYSTEKAPDLQGVNPNAAEANFGGYKELVLDNLVIERVDENVTADTLKALIEDAKTKYNEDDYTAEVWNNFQKEIAKAQVALDKDNSTQEDIEKAYYALKGAMVTMDNSKGLDATDDSRDISTEGMTATAGSQQGTTGSEGPASNVLDGDANTIWHTQYSPSVDSFDKQWIDIATAEPTTVGGVRLQQRSGKNGVIKEAEIWVKTTDADYVKVADASFGGSGWQVVTFEEIENVTNVKIVPKATLGDQPNKFSAAAEIRLMGAKQDATIEIDKSGLKTAIDAAKALKAENYTSETWEVLTTKLTVAEKVYADPEATDYEVLLAIANLTEAIEGLEAVETPEAGDKTELNNLIAQYSGLNEKDYTAESWKAFANALENAKAVSAKENASQAEIDQAIAALTSARAGLVKATDQTTQADKSKLQKFYDECVGFYKEANHSKENWKAYQEALATAKAVLNDKDATQEEVDNALDKLISITVKMNAELKDVSNAPKNPVTGKDNVIKTGDTTSPIGWGVAGMAAVLAVVAAFFARRKKN